MEKRLLDSSKEYATPFTVEALVNRRKGYVGKELNERRYFKRTGQVFHQRKVKRGLIELLDHLDELGMRRCVATSSSRSFAKKALTIVGVLERVDFVITAEDVSKGKPNPDIYLAAAKKLSVDIGNMLVLEDSPTGTKAGVSAGAYVVSVPNEHTKQGCFDGCRWIANSLLDERIYGLLKGCAN